MRYDSIQILKSETGIRYFKAIKYPDIPLTDSDIYIITAFGDSLDVIAQDYYRNTDDYWILYVANDLEKGSRFVPPGTQLRIPQDIAGIKKRFNDLNGIV